jgi:hypothetical protein
VPVTLSKKLSDTAKPSAMLETGGFAFSPYDASLGDKHTLGVSNRHNAANARSDQTSIVPEQSRSSDIFAAAAPPVALEAPAVPLELKFYRCVRERSYVHLIENNA